MDFHFASDGDSSSGSPDLSSAGEEEAQQGVVAQLNDGEDTEHYSVAFWWEMRAVSELAEMVKQGGSVPGKSGNVERNFSDAHRRYMLRYFWPADERRPRFNHRGPTKSEEIFERRFCMPRSVFSRLLEGFTQHEPYFRQGLNPNAAGKLGITPLIKVVTALRQLSYGIPADLCDDLFDVSETTALKCLKTFSATVVDIFSGEYMRQPTSDDIVRIEKKFRAVGFPGCIGAVDCAGWRWKNAPKAMQGSLIRKDWFPVLRAEAICDLDLWIWHFQFGFPGVLNDLNILDLSEHFGNVLTGAFPPAAPSYKIEDEEFKWWYYLADGIYLNWKIFCKTMKEPVLEKERLFCKAQESVRKCVERAFGVLFRQFRITAMPSELWSSGDMQNIALTCVILHNMIVETSWYDYTSDGGRGLSRHYNEAKDLTDLQLTPVQTENVLLRLQQMAATSGNLQCANEHARLRSALIGYIWNRKGNNETYAMEH